MNEDAYRAESASPLHNIELEQQILGHLLNNNDLLFKIGQVEDSHFYDPVHAEIFNKITARIRGNHIASPVTLKMDMETNEGLKELGGPAYLIRLAGSAISSFAVADYGRQLVEVANKRKLQNTLHAAALALPKDGGLTEALSLMSMAIASTTDETGKDNSTSFLAAMMQAIDGINDAYQGKGVGGVQTHLRDLDNALNGGLFKADLIVLGGRPSMGKTALALHVGTEVAKNGGRVVIASAEMTESALAERALAAASGVNYSDARRGAVSEKQFRRIVAKAKEMEAYPIQILPDHVRDPAAILAACRGHQQRDGLDLVIVDYLQLLRAAGRGRTEQMTEVSIQLKAMAKILRVPVIALSQLSRGVESREDKRPQLSDLRETGQIEQDADVVLFCFREFYYLQRESEPKAVIDRETRKLAMEATKTQMEVIVAKQRMGGLGTVKVNCHLPTNRFWDIDKQEDLGF